MGMHEKEFQRCKFSLLVPSSSYKQAAEINDGACSFILFEHQRVDTDVGWFLLDDVIREHRWSDDDLLGVDHIDRTTKRIGERAGAL